MTDSTLDKIARLQAFAKELELAGFIVSTDTDGSFARAHEAALDAIDAAVGDTLATELAKQTAVRLMDWRHHDGSPARLWSLLHDARLEIAALIQARRAAMQPSRPTGWEKG